MTRQSVSRTVASSVLLLTLGLGACAQNGGGYGGGYGGGSSNGGILGSGIDKGTAGTVLGGAAGAWAGSSVGKGSGKIVATAAGAILGGLLGNQIGGALDEADRIRAERTTTTALETGRSGQAVRWQNPDNQNRYGEVVPGPSYSYQGRDCRSYTQTIYIDGRAQRARGTACRTPDGTWQIADNAAG